MATLKQSVRTAFLAVFCCGLVLPSSFGQEFAREKAESALLLAAGESGRGAARDSIGTLPIAAPSPDENARASSEGDSAGQTGAPAATQPDGPEAGENEDTGEDGEGSEEEDEDDEDSEDEEEDEEELPAWLLPPAYHEWGPFTVEYVYTADTFSNVHGGISTKDATKYRGNFDLTITCDLDKLAGIEGGTFFVYGNEGHGRGITADYVGDYQYVSNIDMGNLTQVSEYWWMQSFADETLTTKLGKQDASADFYALDSTADFINSSFGYLPNVLLPMAPDPSVGAAVFYEPNEKLWCGFGIYDGSPDGRTWGWTDWGVEGTIMLSEVALRPNFADGLFPGGYHAGAWYHSGDFDDLVTGQPHAGNYGLYTVSEQMIWKESTDPENDQGLAVFFEFSWAPPEWNQVERYIGAGLLRKGPLGGRDNDYIGVGWGRAVFSPAAPSLHATPELPYALGGPPRPMPLGAGPGSQLSETVVELFYLCEVRPWLYVQPDLQYIGSPSGIERDALAVGVRFEIAL